MSEGEEATAAERRAGDLQRVESGLDAAAAILAEFTPGAVAAERKAWGDPVTEADRRIDQALARLLPGREEGWLSEETADDRERLGRRRVWVVDPLDGTREFVAGIPEWSVSIGLVEDGKAVAGGVLNPAAGHRVVGSLEAGVTLGGRPAGVSRHQSLDGALVLASRSEVERGEWRRFEGRGFTLRPMGSVAYKLALVAAGLADATWTLVPKHEWDVAAGVALVIAAGGVVTTPDGAPCRFNRERPLLPGLVACAPGVAGDVRRLLDAVS